jgi:hypothetical protein
MNESAFAIICWSSGVHRLSIARAQDFQAFHPGLRSQKNSMLYRVVKYFRLKETGSPGAAGSSTLLRFSFRHKVRNLLNLVGRVATKFTS